MNEKIKLTKQEAEVMLDRPHDCVWDNLGPEGADFGFAEDEVYAAVYRLHEAFGGYYSKRKNRYIPENITQLEAEVICSMVDGGLWMAHCDEDEWPDSTPQQRWRARKSFETLCEKLESFDPPKGWDSPPSRWTGGV